MGFGLRDGLLWRGGAARKRGGVLRRAVADPLARLHGPGLGGVVEDEVVEVGGRVRERLLLGGGEAAREADEREQAAEVMEVGGRCN